MKTNIKAVKSTFIDPFNSQRGVQTVNEFAIFADGLKVASGFATKERAEQFMADQSKRGVWERSVERARQRFEKDWTAVTADPSNYDAAYVRKMTKLAEKFGKAVSK